MDKKLERQAVDRQARPGLGCYAGSSAGLSPTAWDQGDLGVQDPRGFVRVNADGGDGSDLVNVWDAASSGSSGRQDLSQDGGMYLPLTAQFNACNARHHRRCRIRRTGDHPGRGYPKYNNHPPLLPIPLHPLPG